MSAARNPRAVTTVIRAFAHLADAAPRLESLNQAELKHKRHLQNAATTAHQLKLTRTNVQNARQTLAAARRAARTKRKAAIAVASDVVGVLRTMTEAVRIVKDLHDTPVPVEYATTAGPYLLITTPHIDVRGQGRTVGRYQVALPLQPDQIHMHTRGWALDGQRDPMNPTYDHPNITPTTRWFCLNQYAVYIEEALRARNLLHSITLVVDALIEGPRDIYLRR